MTSPLVHAWCAANDVPRVVALFNAGELNLREIGEACGLSRSSVTGIIVRATDWQQGQETPHQARVKAERAECVRRATEMLDSGMTRQQAADVLGMKKSMLDEWMIRRVKRDAPRCGMCGIPTDDGEQTEPLAIEHGICDQCMRDLRAGLVYDDNPLPVDVQEAVAYAEAVAAWEG